jgi:hypothetical protein
VKSPKGQKPPEVVKPPGAFFIGINLMSLFHFILKPVGNLAQEMIAGVTSRNAVVAEGRVLEPRGDSGTR